MQAITAGALNVDTTADAYLYAGARMMAPIGVSNPDAMEATPHGW